MIKLIITDLDGTLLNDEKNLSPIFWQTEQQIHEKGVLFSIASGRQYYNLAEKFEKIADRLLFIAENGTYVHYKGKELFVHSIERNKALELISHGKKLKDTHMILCGKNSAYTNSRHSGFIAEASKYYTRLKKVKDLAEVDDEILKVTICDFSGTAQHLPFFKEFQEDFQIALATKIWIDFTQKNANKGTAIATVQKVLNITPDETMVFGDYLNDLEMMKAAKHSYAMKNAHPQIIEAANYITAEDNNNQGVEKTIEKTVLNL